MLSRGSFSGGATYCGMWIAAQRSPQCFVFLNMFAANQPEVMIRNSAEHFDASGRLTDEKMRHQIGKLLEELVALTRRLRKE